MNEIVVRSGVMWRVSYHNPSKARYSAELVAWATKDEDDQVKIILASDPEHPMDQPTFEEYRRKTWPMEHESGRNPDNVTLGVHSGSAQSKGGL
jgi:hypothetical protein